MAKLDLALVVRTVDQATRPLRRIQTAVRQVGRQTGLDRVGRQMRLVGRQVGRVGVEAGRFARRFGLAMGAAGGAVLLFTQRYANIADTAQKMADRIGIGVEEMQRLSHAFDLGGISVNQSQRAMLYFTARIGEATRGTGEAAEVFKAMGISIEDTNGEIKNSGDLFNEVADAMQNQVSPAKRAYAAQMLFGRAGRQMVKVLSEGSAEIRKQGRELDDYRLISESEARAAEEYIDQQLRLKQAVRGLGNAIGADLIPQLTAATIKLREWIIENRPDIIAGFHEVLRELGEIYRFVRDGITATAAAGASFVRWVRDVAPPVADVIDKMRAWLVEFGLVKTAAVLVAAVLGKALLLSVVGLVAPLASLAVAVVLATAKMAAFSVVLLANPIGLVVAALAALAGAVYLIYENWDGIVQYFENIWAGIKDAFDFEWLNKAAEAVGGVFGGGQQAEAVPSLLTPSPAALAMGADKSWAQGGGGKANITVDFRNMPFGARVETRADSDTDLEVTTGYAMQGAR